MGKKMPSWVRGYPMTYAEYTRRWSRVNRLASPVMYATSKYDKYLASRHWHELRGKVLVLSDSTCARCGGVATQVHHITYERLGRERLEDLEPICSNCHRGEHECMSNIVTSWFKRRAREQQRGVP